MTADDLQRVHGDCHVGNILWRDDTPHFVDLDDCISGPVVQDIWMFLNGARINASNSSLISLKVMKSLTTLMRDS